MHSHHGPSVAATLMRGRWWLATTCSAGGAQQHTRHHTREPNNCMPPSGYVEALGQWSTEITKVTLTVFQRTSDPKRPTLSPDLIPFLCSFVCLEPRVAGAVLALERPVPPQGHEGAPGQRTSVVPGREPHPGGGSDGTRVCMCARVYARVSVWMYAYMPTHVIYGRGFTQKTLTSTSLSRC